MSDTVIWILTEYDNLHLVEWAMVKGVEYQFGRRLYRDAAIILLLYELCELDKVFLLEFIGKHFFPTWLYFYVHILYNRYVHFLALGAHLIGPYA